MTELLTTEALETPISVRSEDDRLIDVRIVPWGVVGRTAQGPERMRRGAFRGQAPDSVSLEAIGAHGADPGVRLAGRSVALEDREDGEYGTFRVSRTRDGDELLELARDGVYRAASAVFEPMQSRSTPDGVTERVAARLHRVGIVERGAYDGAAVLAVRSEVGAMVDVADPVALEASIGTVVPVESPEMLERMEDLRRDMLGRFATLEARSSGGGGPHPLSKWSTLGAYLVDASANPDDAVILARALVDQVTGDNPGVVPPSYLSDVAGILVTTRPAVAATGGAKSLGDSGMSIHFPYFDGDLATLVAKQAAEKTEIHSVKVSLKDGSFPIETFAGGSDISYQLIRRSRPAYLEAYGRIMLSGWALTTEKEYETDLLAGATGTITVDGTTDAGIRAGFFAGSSAVRAATGAPASFVLASSDVFAGLGGVLVPPAYGTANQTGTAQASTLRVNVSGLEVTEAPYFPAGTALFGNEAAAGWHEDGPMVATAEDVARLGQNRAYWSMGATGIFIPAGLVKATGVVLPFAAGGSRSRKAE